MILMSYPTQSNHGLKQLMQVTKNYDQTNIHLLMRSQKLNFLTFNYSHLILLTLQKPERYHNKLSSINKMLNVQQKNQL